MSWALGEMNEKLFALLLPCIVFLCYLLFNSRESPSPCCTAMLDINIWSLAQNVGHFTKESYWFLGYCWFSKFLSLWKTFGSYFSGRHLKRLSGFCFSKCISIISSETNYLTPRAESESRLWTHLSRKSGAIYSMLTTTSLLGCMKSGAMEKSLQLSLNVSRTIMLWFSYACCLLWTSWCKHSCNNFCDFLCWFSEAVVANIYQDNNYFIRKIRISKFCC